MEKKPKKTITFRLSKKNKEVHNVLRRVAKREKMSTNYLMEEIIVDYLTGIGETWDTDDE